MSVSMTMNGAVIPVLAMYIIAAEEQVTMATLTLQAIDFVVGCFSRQVVRNYSK